MVTEERVREIVNEELDKRTGSKQESCTHDISGKLVDGVVYCNECGKAL